MSEKTYTLEQIKKAFWSQFHESGELWFDYLGSHEENESSTESAWEDFVEDLDKICPTLHAPDASPECMCPADGLWPGCPIHGTRATRR